MRESSIRLCEAHLHLTADVAMKACQAAASTKAITTTSSTPERTVATPPSCEHVNKITPSSSSPGTASMDTTQGGQREANRDLAVASASAVFRAGCLVAAQGLMDPAEGPRSAGASMAMSLLSLTWLPSRRGVENVDETVVPTGVDDRPQALTDDSTGGRKNETASLRSSNAPENRQSGDNLSGPIDPEHKIAADLLLLLPLKELRWGLELLLGCVAPYLAHGVKEGVNISSPVVLPSKEGAAGGCACGDRGSPTAGEEDCSETTSRDGVNSGENHLEDENRVGAAARLGEGQGTDDADALLHTPRATRNGDRVHIACILIDFSCRCPHVGPALVASILVRWIPFLATWGRRAPPSQPSPPQHNDTTTTRNRAAPFSYGPVAVGLSTTCDRFTAPAAASDKSRSLEAGWKCRGPPGEEAAAEMLAAGAVHMLVLMLRLGVQLLPFSDFSAEALAVAAERAMSFGCIAHGNADRERPRGPQGTSARRSRRRCEARRAGEALMLDLVFTYGVGGTTVAALLPSLNSARGIACLHEASASLLAQGNDRARTDMSRRGDAKAEGVGESGGGEGSFQRGNIRGGGGVERGFGEFYLVCDKCGESKLALFSPGTPLGKIDVRRRLEIPRSWLPSPSGNRELGTGESTLGSGNKPAGDALTSETGDSKDTDDATTAAAERNRQSDVANSRPSSGIGRKLEEEVVGDDGQSGDRRPSHSIEPDGNKKSGRNSKMQSAPKAGEEPADADVGVVVDMHVVATRPASGNRKKVVPLNKGGSMMGASASKSMLVEPGDSSSPGLIAARDASGSDADVSEKKGRGYSAPSNDVTSDHNGAADVAQLANENLGVNSGAGAAEGINNSAVPGRVEEERGGGKRGVTASPGDKHSGGGWMKKTLRWFRR